MLDRTTILSRLSPAQQQQVESATHLVEASDGDDLTPWLADRRAMCAVLRGRVEVRWDAHVAAVHEAGATFGEIELFDGAWRDATATARARTELWALTPEGYERLRDEVPQVAQEFEQAAMVGLARRVRTIAGRIGQVAPRTPLLRPSAPAHESPGDPVPVGPGRVLSALEASPLLAGGPAHALQTLAGLVHPLRFAAGAVIIAPGSLAGGVYVLASGECEVVAPVGDEHCALVSTVAPGGLLGVVSGVDGEAPSLETVCTSNAVVLELEHADFARLCKGPSDLGSMLRHAALRSLCGLITQANGTWVLAALLAEAPGRVVRPPR